MWLKSLGEKSTGNKNNLVSRLQSISSEVRGEFLPDQIIKPVSTEVQNNENDEENVSNLQEE